MSDESGPDAKLLLVPCADSRVDWQELDDVPEPLLLEIAHFFEIYKELEPGKATSIRGWDGRAAAEAEIMRGRDRAAL
jgi:inorganic pyrophosphatase